MSLENLKFSHILILFIAMVLILKYLSYRSAKVSPYLIPITVFLIGFTGMTAQMILIYSFQAIYGYIYHSIGLLIAFFMAGLALGSFLINKNFDKIQNPVNFLALLLIAYAAYLNLLAFCFNFSPAWGFPILTFLAGLPVGAAFPLAIKIYREQVEQVGVLAGVIYGMDLLGGSLAAIITSVFLIPVLGLFNTGLLASVFCLSGLVLLWPMKIR